MQRRERRIIPHLFGQDWIGVAQPVFSYYTGGIAKGLVSAAVTAAGSVSFGTTTHGKRLRNQSPPSPSAKRIKLRGTPPIPQFTSKAPNSNLRPPPGATPTQRQSGNMVQIDEEVPIKPEGNPSISHPDYFNIILPYFDTVRYTLTAATPTVNRHHHWRLNSINDPDVTGSGHQPLGRDTWATVYDYYRVLQTDVLITVTNLTPLSGTGVGAMIFGYQLTDGVDHTEQKIAFMEQKISKGGMLTPFGGGMDTAVYQYTYRPEQWDHHVTQADSSTRWTPIGSAPSINHSLVTSMMPFDPNEGGTIAYTIEFKYHVQLREVNASLKHQSD